MHFFSAIFLQYSHSRLYYAKPVNAAEGIPGCIFGIGFVFFAYVGIGVYIEFKKDNRNN
jgi:hypothetical protein